MYILLAILMLAILITIHEFGHFTAARLMKIEVREFAIGMGPKLIGWKSRKYETDFAVRAIPLGGYCAFYGEDDARGISKDDPRAFPKQNVWKRLFVILMGPMMNFVLAFVVMLLFTWCCGAATVTGYEPYISDVMAAGPAYSAGLKAGDRILEINGTVPSDEDPDAFLDAISEWKEGDAPLRIVVRRGNETISMEMSPQWDDAENRMRIGVLIRYKEKVKLQRLAFGDGISYSFHYCIHASGQVFEALGTLVSKLGQKEAMEQVSGPVGMVTGVSSEVSQYGFWAYIYLLVSISINLGLFNLLPIPGLDGSRLIFGLVEVVRGKAVPPEKEALVHLAGMLLLLALAVYITIHDILKLVR